MIFYQTMNFHEIVAMKAQSGVNQNEGKRLAHLATLVPNGGAIVEIGACQGRSAAYMASALREAEIDALVWSVDLWDLGKGKTPPKHAGGFKRYKSNLRSLGLWNYVRPVRMDSAEASWKWRKRNQPIDLLFIDGDHTYEGVLTDYSHWWDLVAPGGAIVFHDYDENHPGIVRVVDSLVRESEFWTRVYVCERLVSAVRSEKNG